MLLIRSENATWNAVCVGVIVCFWFTSVFLLYNGNSQPPPTFFANNDDLPTATIFPSGSPVVPPPTTPRTRAPFVAGPSTKKRGREDNIDETLLAPFRLGKQNHTVLNPLDYVSHPLPRCSDEKHGRGDFGSFSARKYYSIDVDCLAHFDDSAADFGCLAMFKDHFAASYDAQGRLCRCGGILLKNSVCMFTTSVEFTYEADFDTTPAAKPFCNLSTKWEMGQFVDGRYLPPNENNCQLMDINPRMLQSKFPNQFVFIDGDSHQQDLFWGLISEIRNHRYFAIPALPSAKFGHLGKNVRYEVGEHRDYLELLPLGGAVSLNDPKLRTCYRTQQSQCTVFIYVFDRIPDDYLRSAAMLASNPPDVLIAGFISRAYSRDDDPQTETKQAWQNIFSSLRSPMHFAWTSFPMNSMFIVQNMTEWVNQVLQYPQLRHHFTLTEAPLWDALKVQSAPNEPGYLTLQLTWHADCHVHVDYVTASESCSSPIPRTVYAAMLSIFATT